MVFGDGISVIKIKNLVTNKVCNWICYRLFWLQKTWKLTNFTTTTYPGHNFETEQICHVSFSNFATACNVVNKVVEYSQLHFGHKCGCKIGDWFVFGLSQIFASEDSVILQFQISLTSSQIHHKGLIKNYKMFIFILFGQSLWIISKISQTLWDNIKI